MQVQYSIDNWGKLKVRDDSGRTVILDAVYWAIKTVPENRRYDLLYGVMPRSPKADIPNKLFEGLFYGIRRYHKQGCSKPGAAGYEEPRTVRLREHLKTLEMRLTNELIKQCPFNLEKHLWRRELVLT